MWAMVRTLRESGVTIVLTTHYIEEAQEMADRIGVISHGRIILVEDKDALMRKLGHKQLTLLLRTRLDAVPAALAGHGLTLHANGTELTYTYDPASPQRGVAELLDDLQNAGVRLCDVSTSQRTLEDIFVSLVEASE